jgi:hypothetical protein
VALFSQGPLTGRNRSSCGRTVGSLPLLSIPEWGRPGVVPAQPASNAAEHASASSSRFIEVLRYLGGAAAAGTRRGRATLRRRATRAGRAAPHGRKRATQRGASEFLVQRQRQELRERFLRAHLREDLGGAVEFPDEAAGLDVGELFRDERTDQVGRDLAAVVENAFGRADPLPDLRAADLGGVGIFK